MAIEYRIASKEADQEAIAELAFEVFHTEMGFAAEYVDRERGMLIDAFEAEARYLGAFEGERLVGCLALLSHRGGSFGPDFDTAFSVERFAQIVDLSRVRIAVRFMVRDSHRGSEVPLRLVGEIARLGVSEGVALTFADCQPHLIDLYQALGFDRIGPAFDQPGFGLMVPLALVVAEPYLTAKGSMLGRYVGPLDEEAELVALARELGDSDAVDAAAVWTESWAQRQIAASFSLLDGLTPAQVEVLCARARVIEAPSGSSIVSEGQGARTAYVVLDGVVKVTSGGRELSTLGAGQGVGEMAMLLGRERTADAVAVTDVQLIALNDRVLSELVDGAPELAARLYRNLSRELAVKLAHQS